MDYYFEMVQKLKFCLYDIDNDSHDLGQADFLGELECTLGQVSRIHLTLMMTFHLFLFFLKNSDERQEKEWIESFWTHGILLLDDVVDGQSQYHHSIQDKSSLSSLASTPKR